MSHDTCDVTVVGAGPAGATAATLLRKKDFSVSLIDRATFPRDINCAGWISSRSEPLLAEIGVPRNHLKRCTVRNISFYKGDFSATAKPAFEDSPAYLIDRTEFDSNLVAIAADAGAQVIPGRRVVRLELAETDVATELDDGRRISSRLLILAGGRLSDLGERVGIPVGSAGSNVWVAQVDAALTGRAAPKQPRIAVVLGLDQGSSFGMCALSKKRISIGVHWRGERNQTIPTLVHLCRQALEHGVVPVDLTEAARSVPVIANRAGAALDMDTHVGKHTLLIGEAGGFVSAASGEGIFPAMWSARIAVDVARQALQGVHSQDELMTFNSAWRMEMADYLRAPHTDIQFLLPLVFSNQPLTDRMGAAFFHGENI